MSFLPTGTVTFLFTDIEGSTRLLQQLGARYPEALEAHRQLLRAAIEESDGFEFDTVGDGHFVAFASAKSALAAAVAAQRALYNYPWPGGIPLKVRMGLHTGHPLLVGSSYVGLVLHQTARITQAGHGGQILISHVVRDLVERDAPSGTTFRDLGEHRLKDLTYPSLLFQVVVAGLPSDFPPIRSWRARPHNLPSQLSSFIGREREMAQVKQVLSTNRLLALVGPGGCGKTRLALEVAAEMLEDFKDGVWLVELAPLSDPDLVPQTVAAVLGVREQQGQSILARLSDHLRNKQVLLVLDNCEHLVTACAKFAETLLRSCQHLRILATSREALRIPGEHTIPVLPLAVPDSVHLRPLDAVTRYEAVRLFIERAVAALPTFQLTDQNAMAAVQVCDRLDGIPLAIELAAARIEVLSVEQIAARLDDRFRLLTGGSRTGLPRHRTLRAAIDWSYDLLSDGERRLLGRLSVFVGGFALEAGEAICATQPVQTHEVLDLLTQLVEKSLVGVEHREGPTRYRLLETVRQYGREKLLESGEAPLLYKRHRDWYVEFAEHVDTVLQGLDESVWLDRLEREHDNLRAALEWSLNHEGTDAALRLAGALGWFWYVRGYWSEGRDWFERALAGSSNASVSARAKALYRAGLLMWRLGDYPRAVSLSEEGLELCRKVGDRWGIGFSLNILGAVARYRGEYTRAEALHEEGLAIFRGLEQKWGIALTLGFLGLVAYRQGRYGQATSMHNESLALFRELRQKWGIASALHNAGMAVRCRGDYTRASQLHEESLAYFRELGDKLNISLALRALGIVVRCQGDYARAAALHEESLALSRELGDTAGIASSLNSLGSVAHLQGRYADAEALHEESLALFESLGDKSGAASALCGLGMAAKCLGRTDEAVVKLEESLALRAELGERLGIAECLERLAGVACSEHHMEHGVRLFGAARALRHAIDAPLPPAEHAECSGFVDTARAELGGARFAQACSQGEAMTPEQAITHALGRSTSVSGLG